MFAAIASLALYGMFVFTQTIRHRDFFLPVTHGQHSPVVTSVGGGDSFEHEPVDLDEDGHADPPTDRAAYASLGLLVVSLVAVVGLAKIESPAIESGVAALGFYNWRRVLPTLGDDDATHRLRRSARAELGLGLVVLLVTAVLVALPTP